VYKALLADTVGALSILPVRYRAVLTPPADTGISQLVPAHWTLLPQRGGNLGERMLSALQDLMATGMEAAVVLQSHTPLIPVDDIFEALLWLPKGRRIILGPSSNGSVYLTGCAVPDPRLFEDIDWSGSQATTQVTARAAELGLEVQMLAAKYSVEAPADLDRFSGDLGAGAVSPACSRLFARNDFSGLRTKSSPRG
jgi:glycosyltransferase A (GT-A) superfamily protein (DUF2064 family)